ncbi:MAG: Uma2 family endonuclease [Lachnospiraceae bacterium]|nr:Uma2 family endonuclease [Lachnospiraceae bacterium]
MPLLKDDYKRVEKIDGTIYNMSPSGGFMHSQINGNLYHEIRQQLKKSICVVSIENLDLYLSDDEYVIPDIMIICDRNQIKKDKYRGVPKFVAETLSPATSFKDKTIKKEKYAQLGIDEYWIISPKEHSIEVYYLEDKEYKLVGSHILVEDEEDENYNADLLLTLRSMPTISISLQSIFENID